MVVYPAIYEHGSEIDMKALKLSSKGPRINQFIQDPLGGILTSYGETP